ncbi:MAG: V-type ATP synthase subunit A, partial [Bacteroidales bacterium]|nr:V-type ATP synthase subunit A [Bacteroidales bacterium]
MEAEQGTIGTISGINGSVVHVKGFSGHAVGDMVEISEKLHLMGEIIKIVKDVAVVQCYEETSGLRLHAHVINKEYPLSMELGPGLLNSIYDGIQRPLKTIAQISGNFISRGIKADALDRKKKWLFHPKLQVGDQVVAGDIIGQVKEFSQDHMIMIPPGVSGTIHEIKEGNFTIIEMVYSLKEASGQIREFTMMTRWPIRKPRPYAKRLFPDQPLLTGTRVFDLLFPVARGGSIAIPGGYGT